MMPRCTGGLGPNGNGNLLGFGVLERECNVVLVLGLYDQLWVHAVLCFVAGCRILVPAILIFLSPSCVLIACYAGDGGHGVEVSTEYGVNITCSVSCGCTYHIYITISDYQRSAESPRWITLPQPASSANNALPSGCRTSLFETRPS